MPSFTPRPPNVAVLGCGHWGRNLIRNYHALGALAAICDPNELAAATLAEQFGVPRRDLAAILADPAIDGIVVATPAERHASLVKAGLRAGKHVFVEKPLALDVGEAELLCRLVEQTGRRLMVGHLLRYHPAFVELEKVVSSGAIGRIHYVSSHRLSFGKIRTEENILWSFAPHDISMILALLGDQIESVVAVGHNYLHKDIADVTTTHLTFASGQAAHIHVSWMHPFKEQRLVVVGESGMIVFDDQEDWPAKLLLYPHRVEWRDAAPTATKGAPIPIAVPPAEPLTLECAHFLEVIATGCQPLTDAREGLAVLRVLDASQRSLEKRSPISSMPAPDYFVHPSAVIDQPAKIGSGTRIWHFSHILKNSQVGSGCNIGQNVVIGPDVAIGDHCKIQNNVSIYPGVTLEAGVFCGPSMVFTNVHNPRAEIERKHEYRPTLVKRGATIGANATIICGHTLGRYCFVGAGAVITRDVPDHTIVAGNPAKPIGHVCSCGVKLPTPSPAGFACPACGSTYRLDGDTVTLVEIQRS